MYSKQAKRTCTIFGCERKFYATGLCVTHYRRFKRCGEAGRAEIRKGNFKPTERECQVQDCYRDHYSRDLCQNHYNVVYYSAEAADGQACAESDCTRRCAANGLCRTHYMRIHMKWKNYEDIVPECLQTG